METSVLDNADLVSSRSDPCSMPGAIPERAPTEPVERGTLTLTGADTYIAARFSVPEPCRLNNGDHQQRGVKKGTDNGLRAFNGSDQ